MNFTKSFFFLNRITCFCVPYICEDVNAFLHHFSEINGILQKDMLCCVST